MDLLQQKAGPTFSGAQINKKGLIPVIRSVIKRDGRREEFNPNKLREGIRMACWKRNISTEILDGIVGDITIRLTLLPQDEIRTDVIGEMVMDALKKIDEVAYVRFASVYRHFKDADAFVKEIARELHPEDEASAAGTPAAPAVQEPHSSVPTA